MSSSGSPASRSDAVDSVVLMESMVVLTKLKSLGRLLKRHLLHIHTVPWPDSW